MATPTAANNTATVHTDIEKEDGPISSGFSARMRICRYVRLTLIVRMREFCRSRDFSYRGNREFTTSTHTCGKQEVKNSRGNNAQQPFESRRVFLSLALSRVCVCMYDGCRSCDNGREREHATFHCGLLQRPRRVHHGRHGVHGQVSSGETAAERPGPRERVRADSS